jgi:serpin B
MKALLGLPLLVACSTSAGDPTEVSSGLARNLSPQVADADYAALVAGDTAFAVDLLHQVGGADGNLFFSPHSISQALAMTYAGAAGTTATQMADALHFTLPPATLHAAMDRLDLELASRATAATSDTRPFQLHVANAIWGQDGAPFQAPFLDTLAVNYGAGLHVVDYAHAAETARGTINDWVAARTNDKILDLLPVGSVDAGTRLVLTNAIYFSAAWAHPFEASATADGAFTTTGGPVAVPMLHEVAELSYGAGDGYQAAEIPYDGEQLSMVVIVPDALASFQAALTPDKLAAVLHALSTASVTLTLPKFRFTAPLSLAPALQALGMVDAFGPAADFSGIDGARDLQITGVLHKGFVGIDEAGTEAAAATAVVVGTTSVPEPHTLVVDRPFLFAIRDRPTGAILFVGRVVDPR